MFQKDIRLADIVSIEEWQKTQDCFSESLGITIRTFDRNGRSLTRRSGPSHLCEKIPEDAPMHREYSGICILGEKYRFDRNASKEHMNHKCPLGLDLFVIPIKAFGKRVTAYVVAGPVILDRRKSDAEYAKFAREARLSREELMDSLIEINVFSHSKMRSMVRLLDSVFSHMIQAGYHKKRLAEMAPEVREMDPLFSFYFEEKVFDALLKIAMMALDADSGSVMTLDKNTQNLSIKVASKIDRDIATKTGQKVGEGIAGHAAATSEPILLPKDRDKEGIREKMKRKEIKSSMIVPFHKANNPEVYGVINLNIMRKDRKFTQKDIDLIKELINLASVALLPLSK